MWFGDVDRVAIWLISRLEVEINANGQFEALDVGLWGNTMVPEMTPSFITSTVRRSHSLVDCWILKRSSRFYQVSQLPLNSAWILTFAQTVDATVDVEVHSSST